jgi:predicted Zn-dependent protease
MSILTHAPGGGLFRKSLRKRALALALGSLVLAACATNPVTGRRELALVSESQEIAMGRQYAEEVASSIGLVNDQALQNYVRNLGAPMAAKSERPQLPWEFHVVDDAAVNAFAVPGGFIYVTRGLLAHLNNEAELMSVVGHEIGHVTARHSVAQISRAQLAQIGLGVGSILSPTVAQYGDIAGAGLGVLFLKFGRDDELQADELGFKYALENGYDVREMAKVFEMLAAQAALAGGGRLPEWQSTHPDPGNRIRAANERVAALQVDLSSRKVGAEDFLARINGMIFGVNPRLGYFEGARFYHPDLRFQLDFPSGWKTQNQAAAVVGVSQAQDAIAELRIARGSAAQAAQEFFSQQGIQAGSVTRGTVHGFPVSSATFTVNTESGSLSGIGSFVEYDGSTYRILTYTLADKAASYAQAMRSVHASFDRLTNAAALAVQPVRLRIERVQQAMTLEQFHQQFPSAIGIEELAVLNGVGATEMLRVGQTVKRVVR